MKLPKRLSDILKRKQQFIDSQRGKMEASVLRMQNKLFSEIIAELIPELDVKDGLIQDTPKNYRLLSVLDKTYKDFRLASSQVMLTQITAGITNITNISNKYFQVALSGDLPARFDKVVANANKLINLQIGLDGNKVFKGGYLDALFNSDLIGLDLKQMTSKAVTSNMNMKDYVNLLREKVTGSKDSRGALDRQFNMYAYDLYQRYDAAYNVSLGNEFGFRFFIYQGGLIDDSRDFCAAHNNKVWSIEEMNEWPTWTPSQGEYPMGYEVKAKDIYSVPSYMSYAGYDPGLDRGGYHCRHALGWINDELAFEMRPDLKD